MIIKTTVMNGRSGGRQDIVRAMAPPPLFPRSPGHMGKFRLKDRVSWPAANSPVNNSMLDRAQHLMGPITMKPEIIGLPVGDLPGQIRYGFLILQPLSEGHGTSKKQDRRIAWLRRGRERPSQSVLIDRIGHIIDRLVIANPTDPVARVAGRHGPQDLIFLEITLCFVCLTTDLERPRDSRPRLQNPKAGEKNGRVIKKQPFKRCRPAAKARKKRSSAAEQSNIRITIVFKIQDGQYDQNQNRRALPKTSTG